MAYRGLIDPRALRIYLDQKMQRRACIASRMLSSSVVSPRQTLHELARDHELQLKTKPSPSISGTVHAFTYARVTAQCAEGLHFSAFDYFLIGS